MPSTAELAAPASTLPPGDRSRGVVDSLQDVPRVLLDLPQGRCLIEYRLPDGRYRLVERSIGVRAGDASDPFSVSYRLEDGRVLYRGTCNVAAVDRAHALERISWAPGNGEHAAGKGWQGGVSFGAGDGPASSGSTAASRSVSSRVGPSGPIQASTTFNFNWDPYSHYDYCYYMADENGDVMYVLSCGYDGDSGGCTTMEVSARDDAVEGGEPSAVITRASQRCGAPGGGGGGSGGDPEGPNPPDSVDVDLDRPENIDPAHWEDLTTAEKVLCVANPLECWDVREAANKASTWSANEAFDAGATSTHNNKYDAMRHAYWSALLAREIGAERAEAWTTAHESESQYPDQTCMDQHNNAIGRDLALDAGPGVTDQGLQLRVRAAQLDGQLQEAPGC